jgi:hypothetical protein
LNLINEFVATSSLNLKRLSNRKKITYEKMDLEDAIIVDSENIKIYRNKTKEIS